MIEPAAPRRRWFQFDLGSLLWFTALVAISAFAVHEHWQRVRLETALLRATKDFQRAEALLTAREIELDQMYAEKDIQRSR
jgi:hypothetical protein